jgi:hypothetical protein
MEWANLLIEFVRTEDLQAELAKLDSEWEAVAAWAQPGPWRFNRGAWKVSLLFKRPKGQPPVSPN